MQQYYWLPYRSANQPTQELATLRRQHHLILNAVGEGIYGLDLGGNVTFVNPAAANMIGWEIDHLIGQSMHAVLHHSHADGQTYRREDCPIYKAFRDGSVRRITDEVFWRKDGSSFPVEYISTPLHNETGQLIGAVVTFRDISERQWAEAVLHQTNVDLEQKVQARTAELFEANQRLKELNSLRSRFTSMVCHEFRNPLNNIALSVSSLDRYDTQFAPEQKTAYLISIKSNVERMTQMIDDILVIGKIEEKVLAVQPQPFDLVQFCQTLIGESQYARPQQPIRFSSQSRQIIAHLDERLLRSVLTNLLHNAIRYTPAHKPIQLRLSKRLNQAIFKVQDEGIGIPPEDLPHLFEPFHRGKNVSNIPGTGLGLNIVKQFVDLQKGKISVSSRLNQGSTFTVWLQLQG